MLIKDIKILLNDKRIWLMLAGVFMALALLCIIGKSEKDTIAVHLVIVDYDDTEYSKLMLNFFRENKDFMSYVDIQTASEESALSGFEEGIYDICLIIPEGFVDNLIVIENTPIKALISAKDPTKAVLFKNLLEAYSNYISSVEVACQTLYDVMRSNGYDREAINSENIAISYELVFTALGKDEFFKRMESERFTGISLQRYYIYSLFVLVIMYAGLIAGLNLLYEERNGIIRRLRTTGTGFLGFFASKLFFYTCSYSLVVLLGTVILLIRGEHVPVKIAAFLIFGIFLSCLFFSLLSLVFKTPGSFLITGNAMILLLTVLGGGIIPIMYLPQAIVKIARFTPNYWFMKLLLSC